MSHLRLFFLTILASVVLFVLSASVSAAPLNLPQLAELPELIEEIDVDVKPFHLISDGPGRVWFTSPNDNVIGLLIYTDTASFEVITYTVPTVAGEPYDLIRVNNTIWFTQRKGNKIARLDPADRSFQEFAIPTANSEPKGIALAPDGSIWFVESKVEKIARFVINQQTFEEYAYSSNGLFMPLISQAATKAKSEQVDSTSLTTDDGFEEIAIGSDYSIWTTIPNRNLMVYFSVSRHEFYKISTLPFVRPTAIVVDGDSIPWVIAQATSTATSDQIGRYAPGTLSLWSWYSMPGGGNSPMGLYYHTTSNSRELWFTGTASGNAGRIELGLNHVLRSRQRIALNNNLLSQPQGIIVDAESDVWIAIANRPILVHWQPPYFRYVYLPVITR